MFEYIYDDGMLYNNRMSVACAVHESSSVALCCALRAADRALETYDVLLALAETAPQQHQVSILVHTHSFTTSNNPQRYICHNTYSLLYHRSVALLSWWRNGSSVDWMLNRNRSALENLFFHLDLGYRLLRSKCKGHPFYFCKICHQAVMTGALAVFR